jgi:hypothetical protein
MLDEVKRLIINQCGPVFMGIKPAALFPIRSALCLDCLRALLPRNIKAFILRENGASPGDGSCSLPGNRLLVLLYDKIHLEETLSCGATRLFLVELGYPAVFSMPYILHRLKTRFSGSDFPHEVGLFLGYPLEDVTGFVQHKGQNYKLCGYWKVYGDVEKAKRLFRQYDLCRECMEQYIVSVHKVGYYQRNA